MGNSQSRKARGKLSPRDGIPYQTVSRLPVANQVFLLTLARRVAARDLLPRGDTPETALPLRTQETRGWDRGGDKMHCTWGERTSPSTWSPELLVSEKGTKRRPNRVCALVEHLRT